MAADAKATGEAIAAEATAREQADTDLKADLAQYEDIFTGDVDESVQNWLDAHPEATTSVEDHSLTYEKLVIGTLGFVTPEMFGAVGDGVTDCLPALNRMMEEIDEGTIIIFPPGTYVVSDSFNVYKSGTKLFFSDGATMKMSIVGGDSASSINGHMLGIYNPNNKLSNQNEWVLTRDVSIIGGNFIAESTGNNENAIGIGLHCENIKIIGVHILKANRKGITAQYDVSNLLIRDCIVENCNSYGISVESNNMNPHCHDVIIENTIAVVDCKRVLNANGVDGLRIENCVFKTDELESYGIYIYSGTDTVVNNCNARGTKNTILISSNDSCELINCEANGGTALEMYNCNAHIAGGTYAGNAGILYNDSEDVGKTVYIESVDVKATEIGVEIRKCGIINIANCRLSGNTIGLKLSQHDKGNISGCHINGETGFELTSSRKPLLINGCNIFGEAKGLRGVTLSDTTRPILVGCDVSSDGTALDGWKPHLLIGVVNGEYVNQTY
jgi:hypothetical protein